jgi:hypothetical protein
MFSIERLSGLNSPVVGKTMESLDDEHVKKLHIIAHNKIFAIF